MSVLRDLADESLPIGVGHPALGLDLFLDVDPLLEALRESSG